MIAFDTNLLVRALVMDNPGQAAIARRLMTEDTVFLSRTVLLETEWVLRSRYNKSRSELLAFFRALLETENTVIETAEAIGRKRSDPPRHPGMDCRDPDAMEGESRGGSERLRSVTRSIGTRKAPTSPMRCIWPPAAPP
jgi:hypothetical protein